MSPLSPASVETIIDAASLQFGISRDELIAPTPGNQLAFSARNVVAYVAKSMVKPPPSNVRLAETLGFSNEMNASRAVYAGDRLLVEEEFFADAAIAISLRVDSVMRAAAGVVKAVYREDVPVEIRRTA